MLTPFFEGGNPSPLARKERERNDTIARALENLYQIGINPLCVPTAQNEAAIHI